MYEGLNPVFLRERVMMIYPLRPSKRVFVILDVMNNFYFQDFHPGCIHSPERLNFYIFCAQELQAYDVGNCLSTTMSHITAGGISLFDYMVTGQVKCRGEKISLSSITGQLVMEHNNSFLELESKIGPEFDDYVRLGVITDQGSIDDKNVTQNRVYHSLSARQQGDKIRLISDLFYREILIMPVII